MKISDGEPPRPGLYVAYISENFQSRFLEKKLLVYYGGSWTYSGSDQKCRGTVYGWIGPLPAMEFIE